MLVKPNWFKNNNTGTVEESGRSGKAVESDASFTVGLITDPRRGLPGVRK